MTASNNVSNAGIMHLAFTVGGQPFCRARRAHMSTTVERSGDWPRICIKCQRVCEKREDLKYRQEQARSAELARRGAANW